MRGRRHAGLALSALLLAACGSLAGSGGIGDLRGRTFLSTAVSEGGQPKTLVAGTRIRLSFPRDGSAVSANAGCNHMGGEARIDGGRLLVTQLAMTDMACDAPRMSQDDWLARFLTSGPTLRLSGPDLVLASGVIELRLLDREVADPDRPLVGTRWKVETLIDGDVASSVPQGAEAHLTMKADGTFAGSAGCNLMSGGASVAAKTIAFSDVVTTKMACDTDRTRLEQAVLAVLRNTVPYDIEADVLHLRHPAGKGLDLRAVP